MPGLLVMLWTKFRLNLQQQVWSLRAYALNFVYNETAGIRTQLTLTLFSKKLSRVILFFMGNDEISHGTK